MGQAWRSLRTSMNTCMRRTRLYTYLYSCTCYMLMHWVVDGGHDMMTAEIPDYATDHVACNTYAPMTCICARARISNSHVIGCLRMTFHVHFSHRLQLRLDFIRLSPSQRRNEYLIPAIFPALIRPTVLTRPILSPTSSTTTLPAHPIEQP